MKKKDFFRLTVSELTFMQVLWESSRPLSRSEIMEISLRDPENPLFALNSFHVIVNDLIDKNYIISVEASANGRKNARRFAANISRNEYFALQISSTENYRPDDIPEIFSALLKLSKNANSDNVLDRMEQIIKQKRG